MMATTKKWGKGEFWGLTSDYDPDWMLTDAQKSLRDKLIELCRTKIRPHAIHCDKTYEFPRESLNAMAELGLLGLIVPKEMGGLGENHVAAVMLVETLARYGCPSTAMVYTMHLCACAILLFRYHKNQNIKNLLARLDKEKLVGTISTSDPAAGGHYWFPLSSKVKKLDEHTYKILKYGSWSTSAGFADWYAIQTVSSDFNGDYANLSTFLVYKNEVRASTDDWSALGMHGNQSGPLIVEGIFPANRIIGYAGDGHLSNDEVVNAFFSLLTSGCWNGISLASMDLAKKHVTRKAHADVGMRICDYPTIQDYFGDCLSMTNASRSSVFFLAQMIDKETNNNDWSLHADLKFAPRKNFLHWLLSAKYVAAKNVNSVTDTMLHACGGSGYKTDLGIERLLRDGKAGCVMGPSNEVIRQYVGQTSLLGLSNYWEQHCNERALHQELGKMSLSGKKELAMKILEEVTQEESGNKFNHPFQDTDFENPFNTSPPVCVSQIIKSKDGKLHKPALSPLKFVSLKLISRSDLCKNMSSFIFGLPNPTDHTGCLPGQYVQVRVNFEGRMHERYFSPVSLPNDYGQIELVIRYESQGAVSKCFKKLKTGDQVEFTGPCGGFEYEPNKLDELTILASGAGITPGLQLIRCILSNPSDKTKINLLYYSDNYDEILYREELDKFAAEDDRLRLGHTLGEVPEDWEGREGFIDTQMIDELVPKPDGIKHKILMCGGLTMTIACLHSLRSMRFPSDMIFLYGQFGAEQMRIVYGRNVRLSGHRCDNVA